MDGGRAEAGICLMGMSCCAQKYCFVPDVTTDERMASLFCLIEANPMRQALSNVQKANSGITRIRPQ